MRCHRVPVSPCPCPCHSLSLSHSQDVFPEAALPLGLVEEVVEVAAKGDEDEAKGQEAKDAWKRRRRGTSPVQPNSSDIEMKKPHWGRATTTTTALSLAATTPGRGSVTSGDKMSPFPLRLPGERCWWSPHPGAAWSR